MEINTRQGAKAKVVELSGEVDDKTIPIALEKISRLAHEGGNIILNLGGVEYLSSGGMRLLLSLKRQVKQPYRFILTGLSIELKDSMITSGFIDSFVIKETVEEAEKSL